MTQAPYLLLAEDDSATATIVTDLARSMGWEVALATNGKDVYESFVKREPDLLLLDYYMPEMDGLEVLEQVRRQGTQVPVIMMTAATEEGLILEALRLGATDFLRKPFEHLLLLKVILRRESQRYKSRRINQIIGDRIVSHAVEVNFENDLSVAEAVANYIAGTMIPGPEAYPIRLGVEELVANAVEHGNLGLTLEDKTRALSSLEFDWQAHLRRRAAHPPFCDRRVHVLAQLESGVFEITVRDMGEGFDFNNLPDPLAEENLERPNGRGIYLARQHFDSLAYAGKGNIVTARKKLRQG